MGLSTHILDTHRGAPAAGVEITLELQGETAWQHIGRGTTDPDGRCRTLLGEHTLRTGVYRLRFEVAPYFAQSGVTSLYPFVEITINVRSPEQPHHIPLLVSANGYTTYRGS